MMFPVAVSLTNPRALLGLLSAMVLVTAGLMLTPAHATAQSVLHQVKYTIFSEQPAHVEVFYREADPPNFADYSHNPYLYSPKVKVDVGPDQQWVLDVMLANPDLWAMVTATSGWSPETPNIHCVLAVDGEVVATDAGPKGALCSLRHW